LQAADRGFAASQYNLGYLFASGKLPRNPSAAALWVRRSADQGYRNAESLPGSFYRDGTGVPKDYVQAYLWLNLAAAAGDSGAAKRRDDLEKLMTPERIGEAQALTSKWKPQPVSVESGRDLSFARV